MTSYLEGEGVEGKSEEGNKRRGKKRRKKRKSAKKGRRTVLVMARKTNPLFTHTNFCPGKREKKGGDGTSEPHSLKRDILQYRLNTFAAC